MALQLFVAAGLAALWRTRRLGPLVAEPLPVVVRASETVEGHGRLYQVPAVPGPGGGGAARRGPAPDHGPARAARPTRTPARCARRWPRVTGREPGAVQAILYGPVPRDDAALVTLGQDIDALEGEVRTQ